MHYYRYRPYSEISLKELLYSEIYFTSPEECNDPFDSKTFYVFQSNLEKWKKVILFVTEQGKIPIPDSTLNSFAKHICSQCPLTFEEAMENDLVNNFIASNEGELNFVKIISSRIQSMLRIYQPQTRYFVSFSKSKDEPSMWSHYADKHNGFCLIFKSINGKLLQSHFQKKKSTTRNITNGIALQFSHEISDSFQFFDIDYSADVEQLDAFLNLPVYINGDVNTDEERNKLHKIMESHYLQKSKSWHLEEEARIVWRPPMGYMVGGIWKFSQQERLFHYEPSQLAGIIYGARLDDAKKERLREIIKERQSWQSNLPPYKHIVFNFIEFEAKLSNKQRDVEIVPISILQKNAIMPNDPNFNRLYEEWAAGWGNERDVDGTRITSPGKIKVD
jgi:hypothetical protein